jgi:signal transduction histidine kinase
MIARPGARASGPASTDATHHSRGLFRIFLSLGAFVAAYAVAYRYGMEFSQAAASPFWFPDSVLLCTLLLNRRQSWWMFLVALIPIRTISPVAHDIPLWFLLTATLIDAAKCVVAASLLRHLVKDPLRLSTPQELGVFALIAALLVPAVFAAMGAGARSMMSHDFWLSWEQWFLGNAATQLVITPVLLFWITKGWEDAQPRHAAIEVTMLSLGMIASAFLAATAGESSVALTDSRFYAPIPFLFWAAIRFGMLGASIAVAVLAVFMTGAAIGGHGPFHGESPVEIARALQNFLLLRAGPIYLVAIAVDQRRRTERHNEDLQRSLAYAQRLAVMGELTATIAHEVRQPLAAIMINAGAAEVLLRLPHPPLDALREIIADISASDMHANEAITRIRKFVKDREMQMERVDFNDAVLDSLRLVAGDARHRRVELRCDLSEHLPPVLGDRTQLQQVLLNLIANAIDAMETTAEGSRILTVTTIAHNDAVEARVSDRGCGVALDLLPQLFDSFFTTRKNGTGLGLAIARSIANAHRGTLRAENNPDAGATFIFALPAAALASEHRSEV